MNRRDEEWCIAHTLNESARNGIKEVDLLFLRVSRKERPKDISYLF